ncbi:unnamed protein product [Adineta steineri]|uniref:Uncharacterized protein n=1 Tax=Adineta steineri TaxID=433720 RepID=A0A815C4P4_9BILA|nr:unnamed protein product [Adineta steineri]CAF3894483.1 unnamed protein product [Adineta steineri]
MCWSLEVSLAFATVHLGSALREPLVREVPLHTCLVDMIKCNTGLLCLEWRQVCDGIVQCENGADEVGCHDFELQNCSSDEFQCRN